MLSKIRGFCVGSFLTMQKKVKLHFEATSLNDQFHYFPTLYGPPLILPEKKRIRETLVLNRGNKSDKISNLLTRGGGGQDLKHCKSAKLR